MRRLVGSLVFLGVAFGAHVAEAQVAQDFASCTADLAVCDATHEDCCIRTFDAIGFDRAIIIPMDRCHQVVAASGRLAPPTATAAWCSDPGPFITGDYGMYETYGLVFRLMQNGIPVHWVINPTKDPPALTSKQNLASQVYTARDIDLWVLTAGATPPAGSPLTTCNGTCTPPVALLDPTTLAPNPSWTYSMRQFPVRGSAFMIAPEDRARFNAFWRKQGEFTSLAGNPNYDFSAIDLYELASSAHIAYQDYRTPIPHVLGNGGNGAPVAVRIDYPPPRLARLAPAGMSENWLQLARLHVAADYPACLTGASAPADAVFCDVTKIDIGNGALVAGSFDLTWIDNWSSPSPCETPAEQNQVDQLLQFMRHVDDVRAGGHAMLMESVVDVLERCANRQPQGVVGDGVGLLADSIRPKEPFILRWPQNVFMQWGDLPTKFNQGAITRWRYFGGGAAGYSPAHTNAATGTLVRLVTQDRSATGNALCSQHRSTPACDVYAASANADYFDVASYVRFEDDPANGVAFYMGGNQIMNGPSQLRMVLNTLISLRRAEEGKLPLASVP